MRKNNFTTKKISRIVAVVCTLSCMLTGINSANEGLGTVKAAARLKLSKKNISVYIGQKKTVKFTAPSKVKVSCSNKKIAKVSVSGKKIAVVGVKKGNTKVTVKCKKKKATINVNVKIKKKTIDVKQTSSPNIASLEPTLKPTSKPTLKPSATPTVDPKIIVSYAKQLAPYAVGENKFSCELFNGFKNSNDNSFISPYSIYMALAMLANGASGNTQAQLLTALGTTDLTELNAISEGYNTGSLDTNVTIDIANSLWLANNQNVSSGIDKNFISPLKKYYQADVFRDINFGLPQTVSRVNNWISDKTNGMLKNVIERFSPDTIMTLVNTVYFNGRWSSIFNKNDTLDETFYGTTGNNTVKMMNKSDEKFNYYCDDNFRGLSLDYGRNGRYSMGILLSTDETKRTGDVWNTLTKEQQMAAISNLDNIGRYQKIRTLKFPKFDLNYDAPRVTEVLKQMGVTDIFCPNADFHNIANGLFVSNIIHKTVLKVEEEGAEAAAVTTISAPTSAMQKPEEPPVIDFIVNRPFVFCIRDNVSGIILFIGEVNNL